MLVSKITHCVDKTWPEIANLDTMKVKALKKRSPVVTVLLSLSFARKLNGLSGGLNIAANTNIYATT